jgi:hypothetical protein
MISIDSATAVIGLADELAQKGIVVTAKPNTFLAELMRNTTLDNNYTECIGDDVNRSLNNHADTIVMGTANRGADMSLHSLCADNINKVVVTAALAHVAFAKNTVSPLVGEFADMVKKDLDSYKKPTPTEAFNVVQLTVPEILSDKSFTSQFSRYENKIPVEPSTNNLEINEIPDMLALLLTGDKDMDRDITSWFSRQGEGFFRDVMYHLVSSKQPLHNCEVLVDKPLSYKSIQGLNIFLKLDVSLALYLMAMKMFDSSDLAKNSSLAVYQTRVAEIRDFAATILAITLNQHTKQTNTGVLVISVLPEKKTIYVNGENYRKWLETGGSIEVILGLLVSGKKFFTQFLIDEQAETLKKSWATYCLFENTAHSNRSFDRFKEILRLCFDRLMSDLATNEVSPDTPIIDVASGIDKRFDQVINELTIADMQDLHSVALRLICRTRFNYTASERILTDIQQAGIINPDIKDAREAALVATLNYMADYVADQIAIAKNM